MSEPTESTEVRVKRSYNKFDSDAKKGHPSTYPKEILRKVVVMRYKNKIRSQDPKPCEVCGGPVRAESKRLHLRSKKCMGKRVVVENI